MTYEEWLDGLPFYMTKDGRGRGARMDLSVCGYGHGRLTVLRYAKKDTGGPAEQLLASKDEAMRAFSDIWERARKYAEEHAPES